MSLSQNIKRLRLEKGMTQEQFANILGVSAQAVSKWESEMTMPDVMLLPTIADTFQCSIDDLFSYVPKAKREKLNVLPGDSVPDDMRKYVADQIQSQLDHKGSANMFLEIMTDNLSGTFELTDENIERLLDSYRELYKGMRNKKK